MAPRRKGKITVLDTGAMQVSFPVEDNTMTRRHNKGKKATDPPSAEPEDLFRVRDNQVSETPVRPQRLRKPSQRLTDPSNALATEILFTPTPSERRDGRQRGQGMSRHEIPPISQPQFTRSRGNPTPRLPSVGPSRHVTFRSPSLTTGSPHSFTSDPPRSTEPSSDNAEEDLLRSSVRSRTSSRASSRYSDSRASSRSSRSCSSARSHASSRSSHPRSSSPLLAFPSTTAGPIPSDQGRSSRSGPAGSKKRFAAADVWSFFDNDGIKRCCMFCRELNKSDPQHDESTFSIKTATGTLRRHLIDCHFLEWDSACEKQGIQMNSKAGKAAKARFQQDGGPRSDGKRIPFTREAFIDAIAEFIVTDDVSINIVESPRLQKLFLMLREDLNESDIPGRTTIRSRIRELQVEHLNQLKSDMKKSAGKISLTCDVWSDPNLTPFLAVTSHWMDEFMEETTSGTRTRLRLRSNLIGFREVPGRHTGQHLATAFLYVLERIGITNRIGWITSDNASNNDSCMACLERELRRRGIEFSKIKHRIRCFPHVVNLACQAILSAITQMDYADEDLVDFDPETAGVNRDVIAMIRSLVRSIRASSLRRQHFASVLKTLKQDNLQLLRDVSVRWSSTLLMIDRAILLRPAIEKFLEHDDFSELRKFQLDEDEWQTLCIYRLILLVPHSFQQILSHEKTPSLCHAIPAYYAMMTVWKEQQDDFPNMHNIIQAGLDKLEAYYERTDLAPAYMSAMILNPYIKLTWFEEHMPERLAPAKKCFIDALKPYRKEGDVPAPPADGERTSQLPRERAHDILRLNRPRNLAANRTIDTVAELFLNDNLIEENTFNHMTHYYQENVLRLPEIYAHAMDVLPIQASAVPCERVFSSAKETMAARRNRIAPDLMEALQMLKYSVRNGHHLNFTAGTGWEAEVMEMDQHAGMLQQVPEDVHSFSETLYQSI